jgi:DNA polymerase-3 subunit delta
VSQKQLKAEIERGFPQHIYLLTASDAYLLYDALQQIKAWSGTDPFALEIIDFAFSDDCPTVAGLVDILCTVPFLAARKTVIVRNLQKMPKKEAKKLEDYCSQPSPSTLLIMLHEGASPKLFEPGTLRNIKTIPLNVADADIPAWVKGQAQRKGMTLSDRAVETLVTEVGTDLGLLHAEVEKLAMAGITGDVSDEVLKEIVYAGAEHGAFDLTSALDRRDARGVFRLYENVRKTTDPYMLLGAFNYHFTSRRGRVPQGTSIFAALHEADFAVKSSRSYVIEHLLYSLTRREK